MADPKHAFRLGLFSPHLTYRVTSDAIEWTDQHTHRRITFGDIDTIRLFTVRKFGVARQTSALAWRCVVQTHNGQTTTVAQDHFVRIGLREDRGLSFRFFVNTLIARASETNPRIIISHDRAGRSRKASSVSAQIVTQCFNILRRLNPDHASALGGFVMRTVGPHLPEHRTGQDNLAAAFPDKTSSEIENILRNVWDNYGRVCAGIATLDRIKPFKNDEHSNANIFLSEATIRLLQQYRLDRKPRLLFTAHLANWEVPAPLGRALGVDLVVPVRVQHLGPIAKVLSDARPGGTETYIPITSDAPFKLKSAIDRGACVAVMVDQHDADGIDVQFFGRTCRVNPILARLARSLDWPIYGIRAIRLPDHRLCIDVVGPIEPPLDSAGRIDIPATVQLFMSIVEQWTREHPDQWMWLHRLWRKT